MAFGDLVKSLVVRFTSEDFELVKAEIDDIPDDKTVKISYERSDFNRAIEDLAKLGRDMDSLERDFGGNNSNGGSGFFGRLFGSFAPGGGSFGGGTPLQAIFSNPYTATAAIGAIAALVPEVVGLASGLAAAAQGAVAFGALAYPTFTTISGAITQIGTDTTAYQSATTAAAKSTALAKIKADWAALDPVQKNAVKDVMSLQTQFDNLAKKLEPSLAPIINTVLGKNGIVSQIINDLPPFASAFAKAIEPLLKQFSNFLASPGAQQFQNTMLQIEKLAVPAIGRGIGQVASAIGKLFTVFSAKDDARAITIFFDAIAFAIDYVVASVKLMKTAWDWVSQKAWPAMKHAFDNFSHASDNIIHAVGNVIGAFKDVIHWIGNVIGAFNHAIDNVRHFVAVAGEDINRFFLNIQHWIGQAVNWFAQLPGRIISAISGLARMLFNAGKNAIQGLINGIQSMMGGVGGVMHAVMSVVGSFLPGSPAKTGPLSGDGWSYVRGQHFAADFGAGMLSRSSAVSAAARGVATAAGLNASARAGAGGHAGAGAPVTVVLDIRGGTADIRTFLKKMIRVSGGNPAVIGR